MDHFVSFYATKSYMHVEWNERGRVREEECDRKSARETERK